MEIDLANEGAVLPGNPATLQAEVCIVGGGVVGLVLAHRLVQRGVQVLLLEAGGHQAAAAPEVDLAGTQHRGSDEGRPRVLGGSSVLWGGQLLPLPAEAAWPVSARELTPFHREIEELLGTDHLAYGAAAFFMQQGVPQPRVLTADPALCGRLSKFTPFGRRNLAPSLGRALRSDPHARVVLHAEACALTLAPGGERVRVVEACGPGQRRLRVQARHVVLAAGTVETCRLLLSSRGQHPHGIGNGHGLVGQGFHDHLTTEVAVFREEARARVVSTFRPWIIGGLRGTVHALKLEANAQLRDRLGIEPALAHVVFDEPEGSGLASVRQGLRRHQHAGPGRADLPLTALPRAAREAWRLWQEAEHSGRRYLSSQARVSLRVNLAQSPSPRSRIRLSDRIDRLGVPLALIEWHHSAADLRTARLFSQQLRELFSPAAFPGVVWGEAALPRAAAGHAAKDAAAELDRPLPGLEDARHAMGGAVMGTDPRRSVVSPELRVHGVANLFVASAAVFPDGSPQLPSLTLLALTLRLADKLCQELRAPIL